MPPPVIIPFSLACLFLAATSPDQAWENATLIDEQTSAPGFYRCVYTTLGGHQFSIIVDHRCSLSVMVNPKTGEVDEK